MKSIYIYIYIYMLT